MFTGVALSLRAGAACALLAALCTWATALAQPGAPGSQRVVDLIEQLRAAGVSIIYSSDLVPDTLIVEREFADPDLLERLRTALAAHRLKLNPGPRDSFLIVRDENAAAPDPIDTAAPAPPIVFGPPRLEDLIVSASRYAFARATGASTTRIDRSGIDNNPSFGDDALRATHKLPGLTSSGLTAQFNVRGGAANEALLMLDGVALAAPFHMKDFESVFSSINPRIIESMDIYTGAFPAEFGERLSAVVKMRSAHPLEDRIYEVEVSTLTSTVLSSGLFADGRASWTTSARRGNLDLLIDAANSDVGRPQIVDFFNDLAFELNDHWTVHAGLLVLDDKISLRDDDVASASAEYDDRYVWVRAEQRSDKLSSTFVTSASSRNSERLGAVTDPGRSVGTLNDSRQFRHRALNAAWSYNFSPTQHLNWGVNLRDADADYRFVASVSEQLPILAPDFGRPDPNLDEDVDYEGTDKAAYLSYRAQAGTRITTELGLRWDRQDYLHDEQLSPRFNVLFDIGERASLRGSWGRYFQPQRLDEIQVADGDSLLYPAQESEHTVIGVEYLFGETSTVRIEAYRKEFEDPRPRYENLYTRISLLPELLPDRITVFPRFGSATGVELSADGQVESWDWWFNLTRANSNDEISGRRAPRSWEERWSAKAGMTWRGRAWTVSVAAIWHSGWPVTPLSLLDGELVAGTYNSGRFGQYESLDLRASRRIALDKGELEWFVEFSNALDRDNPCCIDYDVGFDAEGVPASLALGTDTWLPAIPTIGIRWRSTR